MLRRLKLLKRLQEVRLSPEEAQTLLERVKTHNSSTEDRERLTELIRATTEVADQLRAAPAVPAPLFPQRLSPPRKAKRKRQLVKAARRHNRRV